MLVAAACCPHPPLLVPEVAVSSDPELDRLRAACLAAVSTLVAAEPDRIVLVGGNTPVVGRSDHVGGLRPFGVRAGGAGAPYGDAQGATLSLTVGDWLLGQTGWTGERIRHLAVEPAGRPRAELPADPEGQRSVLLCLADGSAKRSSASPGYLDDRAAPFDAAIATALRTGDAVALRTLDAELAAELWAGGVPAWRVLGACAARRSDAGSGTPRAELSYDEAPFGVGYLVATWTWS